MQRLALIVAVSLLAASVLAACGGSHPSNPDAPVPQNDGGTTQSDAVVSYDGGALAADFVAQGCAQLEQWTSDGGSPDDDGGVVTGTVCVGYAPLTLTFVPITSANVESYVWTFGEPDETPLRDETPTHTFVLPGSYDVSLTVGGPAGTLSVRHDPPFVQVLANAAGAPCDVGAQCAAGLDCSCPLGAQDDTACPVAFGGRGLCTHACSTDADCGDAAVCADLGLGAAWRGPICLAACDAATTCAAGLSCRELPAAGAGGEWSDACFPAFLGDVGVRCFDADGTPVPSSCVGGLCLDLGTAGYCSASCDVGECPAGSACARLGGPGGHAVCLVSCDVDPCTDDPLLGCETPDATGQLGFEVIDVSPPVGSAFCAPRRCTTSADCQGLPCVELDGASFCQR